jgi:hypothetical protein
MTQFVHDRSEQIDTPRGFEVAVAIGVKFRIVQRRGVEIPAVARGGRVERDGARSGQAKRRTGRSAMAKLTDDNVANCCGLRPCDDRREMAASKIGCSWTSANGALGEALLSPPAAINGIATVTLKENSDVLPLASVAVATSLLPDTAPPAPIVASFAPGDV